MIWFILGFIAGHYFEKYYSTPSQMLWYYVELGVKKLSDMVRQMIKEK